MTMPELFSNPNTALQKITDKISTDILDSMGRKARELGAEAEITYPTSITISFDIEGSGNSGAPYDMKPAFRNSPKAKQKANGGWYLIVPINQKVASLSPYVSRQISDLSIQEGKSSVTGYIDMLYEGKSYLSTSSFLASKDMGGNVTKHMNYGNNIYTAFRTVSDKSPYDSWILNRNGSSNMTNYSNTVNALMDASIKEVLN